MYANFWNAIVYAHSRNFLLSEIKKIYINALLYSTILKEVINSSILPFTCLCRTIAEWTLEVVQHDRTVTERQILFWYGCKQDQTSLATGVQHPFSASLASGVARMGPKLESQYRVVHAVVQFIGRIAVLSYGSIAIFINKLIWITRYEYFIFMQI